jgi:hypothetical protein
MSFSNGGADTFDESKSYIGVRLQQGVPLLDRDWNELEDIRRHVERMLHQHYLGDGVPDADGFAVLAPDTAVADDVFINGGRCIAAGWEVWNQHDRVLFSAQGDRIQLPAADPDADDTLTLYLEPEVIRVDSTQDPVLANSQDVNLETCVRDQLLWAVRAVRKPEVPPLGSYPLAEINRPAATENITSTMITDLRRVELNLAGTVDRITAAEHRITAVAAAMTQAQLDIDAMKQDLGRLFWDVAVASTVKTALFGGRSNISISVHDRLGNPIQGALLSLTSDWGVLYPSFASTDAAGHASVDLVGVYGDVPLRDPDVGLLQRASQRVQAAVLPNASAIEYARLRFEPEEIGVLSRYTPSTHLIDIGTDLPIAPIVAVPDLRTATVTVHAKEGQGVIVRGTGSVQVTFGLWMRDFVRTKIADVARTVEVGARVGDILRQGIANNQFDFERVATQLLPTTMQAIHDDTHQAIKAMIFANPEIDDEHVAGTGQLSRVIAQEATAAVGGRTNQAIVSQLDLFTQTAEIPVDAATAGAARTMILQRSSQIAAGFSQHQRQQFSGALVGR